MKNFLRVAIAILFFVFSIDANAQFGNGGTFKVPEPVKWTFSTEQLNDSEFVLVSHAKIDKDWHVYTQKLDPRAIQNPTAFTYTVTKDFILDDSTKEVGKIITVEDSNPKETETFFLDSVNYRQKIIIRNFKGFIVKGNVYFQTCNSSMCMPPKQVDFSFTVPPVNKTSKKSGYGWIWILGFLGGLAALFTPCVFPMVPLTVSFFTKRSKDKKKGLRNAVLYASSIIVIYVLLGLIITAILGPSGMNAIASNGWVNLIFFIIFVIFGFSFLGAFELTLPSSWVNRADNVSERGGFMGVFFMALTLCLVSFSCTAPIVGSLLAEAASDGKYWNLVIGMFGFSVAVALPFALFAAFPAWLNTLPQSGGWLNSVKVVLGLLEIAFSLKFLSTSDLVGLHIKFLHFHINGPMGILKREIFIALWIVIFAIIGLYLIGKIKFHHDSELKHVSVTRLMIGILAFTFSIYLLPGMFGAPLKLIGGFPPPERYSEGWGTSAGSSGGTTDGTKSSSVSRNKNQSLGCPYDLSCYSDYNDAVAYAKQVNKPIMIDFTGYSCVNCRKMEANVWSDSRVLNVMKNDYVLVSLYVDDPTELPAAEQTVSKVTGQKIETVGDKWSDMEASLYKSSTQPLYALVDKDSKLLTDIRGYNTDIDAYVKFLEDGKKNFHP